MVGGSSLHITGHRAPLFSNQRCRSHPPDRIYPISRLPIEHPWGTEMPSTRIHPPMSSVCNIAPTEGSQVRFFCNSEVSSVGPSFTKSSTEAAYNASRFQRRPRMLRCDHRIMGRNTRPEAPRHLVAPRHFALMDNPRRAR